MASWYPVVESKNFSARDFRELNREFLRCVRAQDAVALAAGYYAHDARILPPNQPIVKGQRAILKYWRGLFADGLRDIKLKTLRTEVSGDLAYEIAEWWIGSVKGKHVLVYRWVKSGPQKRVKSGRKSEWRVVADMMSRNDAVS